MRPVLLSCVALLALSACNSKPTTIEPNSTDDQQAALAKAKPVTLPPSIVASKTYRCEDNSVVYADWFADGSVAVKTDKAAAPTKLAVAAVAGETMSGSGYSVLGAKDASTVTIATPAHAKPQKCDA